MRFDSAARARAYSHHSPGGLPGRAARGPPSQKGDLPSSGERMLNWSKVADARKGPIGKGPDIGQETRASHVLGAKGVFTQSRTLLDNRTRDGFVPAKAVEL